MSLGRHTLINLASAVLPMGLGLVTVPLYLHAVGTERYGTLAVIWALLAYFGFLDLGFGIAVVRRIASLQSTSTSEPSDILWTALLSTTCLGVISGVLLSLLSGSVLELIGILPAGNHNDADVALRWLMLAPPILLPTTAMIGALGARLRFAEIGVVQVVCNACAQLFPLAVALGGRTELGALVPTILASRLIMAIALFWLCRRHVPLVGWPRIDREHFKGMLGYGGWVSGKAFIGPLLLTFDRFLIASQCGAASVTNYTVPYDLVSRTLIIPGSFSAALFPRLASIERADSRALAQRSCKILLVAMTPMVIVGVCLSRDFFDIWLGTSFSDSAFGVSELLLWGVWLNSLVIPHHTGRIASGDARTAVLLYLFEAPIYFVALWFGLKLWNVQGAAAAWSLRVLIDTCLLLHVERVLSKTFRLAAPYFVLVVIATVGVWKLPRELFAHLGLAMCLIGICLLIDRRIISVEAKALLTGKVALS